MARSSYQKVYVCTVCEREVAGNHELTVKKASFHSMGNKAKTVRSRVLHWLCPECLKKDPDWHRDAYAEPGAEAPKIAPKGEQLEIPLA